ncbi:hypothetical protein SKAU_G00420720 [Synaphobranchus kaupii]|uniref:C2H2-type domain-containing protein n=1 Tax=Synaphobranchus kaupii TaxID=118154 RepID=A0A9Q1E6L8_SYNKA|nr:hypothetical protein SKAU_G00420720 [Synaphobranchus kaupii]
MPSRRSLPQTKRKAKKRVNLRKEMDDDDDLDDALEPGEINLDPSLLMYYQSTQDPDVLEHLLEQADSLPKKSADEDYITFEYIDAHFQLQDREAEHDGGNDENVRHYLEMKDRREKCTFCRRHFMTAYHHRRHRRAHYGDRPYLCVVNGCGGPV